MAKRPNVGRGNLFFRRGPPWLSFFFLLRFSTPCHVLLNITALRSAFSFFVRQEKELFNSSNFPIVDIVIPTIEYVCLGVCWCVGVLVCLSVCSAVFRRSIFNLSASAAKDTGAAVSGGAESALVLPAKSQSHFIESIDQETGEIQRLTPFLRRCVFLSLE